MLQLIKKVTKIEHEQASHMKKVIGDQFHREV
jgi:hypothetical protein